MTEALESIFQFLRPVPSKFALLRIGGKFDGGYLVPDDLEGVQHCFSPGVDNRKNFEDELSLDYGVYCHMADFSSSVNDFKTPLIEGRQTFRKKWLGSSTSGDDISLEDWILDVETAVDSELMVQMDIEGAEYSVVPSIPDRLLKRIRIFLLELHDLQKLSDPVWTHNTFLPLINKLRSNFDVIHVHPNNCCEIVSIHPDQPRVPRILEVTLIRKDRNRRAGEERIFAPHLPHPMDIFWNVAGRSPKHLDKSWLSGRRPWRSTFRILQDNLRFHLSWRWRRKLPVRYQVLARDLRESLRQLVVSVKAIIGSRLNLLTHGRSRRKFDEHR